MDDSLPLTLLCSRARTLQAHDHCGDDEERRDARCSPTIAQGESPSAPLSYSFLKLTSVRQATTLQLSHILAYQSRLQSLGTAHYAPPATKTASRQLADSVSQFDAVCSQVHLRIVRWL